MDITLVVLAAGIGARYGAGVKQLVRVGPSGEIILDYAVHDAVLAGFNKVVFIVRRDIYEDFRQVLGNQLERKLAARGVQVNYVFQEMGGLPKGRIRPWGTGQAVLCCKDVLNGPFAVINSDDYYGKEAFEKAYAFLKDYRPEEPWRLGMIGFVLKNTLSETGGVTRGVCETDIAGRLARVVETRNIVSTPAGAAVKTADGLAPLDGERLVSMNFWMLTPAFVRELATGFAAFRAGLKDPLKDEYLLPEIIDGLLQAGRATVEVLPTGDRWFGVTYQQDKDAVVQAFRELAEEGVYRQELFSDL